MPEPHVHLLILVHGLWGETKHVAQLAKEAKERCAKDKEPSSIYDAPPVASMARRVSVGLVEPSEVKLVVYLTKSNEGTQTYDGIDYCAERICDEIDAEVKRIHDAGEGLVKRFSIVGYSLGGCMARYAIGLLQSRTPSFFQDVRPVNFATIASPAIGMPRRHGAFHGFRHYAGARLLSRTGRQVHCIDKFRGDKPLLEVMTEPGSSFHTALTAFERIEIYANIAKDWNVTYPTGGIAVHDPFGEAIANSQKARAELNIADSEIIDLREGGLEFTMDEKYPPIIVSWKDCEPIKPVIDPNAPPAERQLLPRYLRPSSYPWWPTPVRYIFVCAFPVAFPLFLGFLASMLSYQSFKSQKRIRILRRRTELQTRASRLTRVGLKEQLDEAVDVAVSLTDTGSMTKEDELQLTDEKLGPHDSLLTPAQLRMIKNLDAIPQLRKHLVWFAEGLNGHAMIICRDPAQYPPHEQGRAVLRHWCDGFRL